MVKCWLLSDYIIDQREECHLNNPIYLNIKELNKIGVEYFYISTNKMNLELDKISIERGYNYKDEIIVSRDKLLQNYEACVKRFFEEHLHLDDEIRYVIDGYGYFDVRNKEEKWIRIFCEPGDLLILPAGIFHRFTVTKDDYIHVIRLFKGEPVWTAFNRTDKQVENMEIRKTYLSQIDSRKIIK
ncbi:1,2-dihydroxy-3-keto-5-methylthiopentene dioxygenase [Meloidogyne graminicola]|uniref:Acireductone dioxygenase n=1 Tax=Meloidogyne graminicola TaxID=189291 RepID=A0A8S9ZFK6_9BILA|nr:1,2-dihydroxy-3-keto-5-methylthiopentene dioxygenase [Meloidogyne graminicola]